MFIYDTTINVVSSASKNYDDRSQLKELRCPIRLKNISPFFHVV